ncbi:MAG: S8 family serine peptidase, partial [Actinomycetota bacterium]|nr:S8 family serine peptidase [Actinomycetota bacterium]
MERGRFTKRTCGTILGSAILFAAVGGPAAAAEVDPYRDRQWGLKKVSAAAAWKVTRGRGALIAIVDTGVDLGHPDLRKHIENRPGSDFVTGMTEDTAQDENGHGTHVAGIAAALAGNGIGVAGVAPGARILPVRVLDADGSGSAADVASGIRFAAEQGADVINLSLGVGGAVSVTSLIGGDEAMAAAIDFAWAEGAVVVAAAGNDSLPFCSQPSGAPNILCVGATDENDKLSLFSNSNLLSSKMNYIVAPGGSGKTCDGDILSTMLRSAPREACTVKKGYASLAGTSMATPFVSGAA